MIHMPFRSWHDAHEYAKKKAKHGTWIVWKNKEGLSYAARASIDTYMKALLCGKSVIIAVIDPQGCSYRYGWTGGLYLLRNAQIGII